MTNLESELLDRDAWSAPNPAAQHFHWEVGKSALEEFARSHSLSDVLRELIQNEYDARGRSMSIAFGPSSLTILGAGDPIDDHGWKRLSVVFGTGESGSSQDRIPAKRNGLGSKNFGLRSLFLIGDTIYIRSAGRQSVLSLDRGALADPIVDETSLGKRGVTVTVPYRTSATGSLPSFDVSAERAAFGQFEERLALNLLKLPRPGSVPSLSRVNVHSERLGRAIVCTPTASSVPLGRGVTLVERRVRIQELGTVGERPSTGGLRELEFQTTVRTSGALRPRNLPSYFLLARGRIQIGLSLSMKGRRPDLSQTGSVYYPLQASNGSTGCAVSLSAPFEMDQDRSRPVDAEVSPWNAWLVESAVEFATKLLTTDWYGRFQSTSYLAWRPLGATPIPNFRDGVLEALKSEPLWPTRARQRGRPVYEQAVKLATPASPSLTSFLDKRQLLDEPLRVDADARELAVQSGSPAFGLNSAIRLRCAPAEAESLNTTLREDEANYHYTNFPAPLLKPDVQKQFSEAFDAGRPTQDNLADLRESQTTLTAAGTLGVGEKLWAVEVHLVGPASVPLEDQLHPTLTNSRILGRKIARRFDVAKWVLDVAMRAASGAADDAERQALYRYLVSTPTPRLQSHAWSTLRRAPILLDSCGRWALPIEVLVPSAGVPPQLAAALHIAHNDYARNADLRKRLHLRDKLRGSDLVSCAKQVATNPELAEAFEALVKKSSRLLSPRIRGQLSGIPCLLDATGRPAAPATPLYIPTDDNEKVLGDSVAYVAGTELKLYELLGCAQHPSSAAIVHRLELFRTAGDNPAQPSRIYTALVDALRRESAKTDSYSLEPLLWIGSVWVAPIRALVGAKNADVFLQSVPIVRGALARVARELGTPSEPNEWHWSALFNWIGGRYPTGGRVRPSERAALRRAMTVLEFIPDDVDVGAAFLLDRTGSTHSLVEVEKKTFLLDDDADLANAIEKAGLAFSFADRSDVRFERFYAALGVARLSEISQPGEVVLGAEQKARDWLLPLFEQLKAPYLPDAIARLVAEEDPKMVPRPSELAARLASLEALLLVRTLEVRYRVGAVQVAVPRRAAVVDGRIALAGVQSKSEVRDLLAEIIAKLAHDSASVQARLAERIYRLLTCESAYEVGAYLRSRGIDWSDVGASDAPFDEDGSFADEGEDEAEATRRRLGNILKQALDESASRGASGSEGRPASSESGGGVHATDSAETEEPFPAMNEVVTEIVPPVTWEPVVGTKGTGGGGGGNAWRPRTVEQEERDRALGRRGEEVVLREERKRVKKLGFPASRVVWVAETNPAANYDIRSVDDDGADLYLEVKTTVGDHGRFSWPRAEFDCAVKERNRYILWRVYEGRTRNPKARAFRDPIGLLLADEMKVDLDGLSAEVGPL